MTLPAPLLDPLFCIVAVIAVLLTGISKGGFGGAFGGVAVPLMALAVSPLAAAAIMPPVLCFIDWWGVRMFWRRWDARNLRIIVPGAIIGIVIAALLSGAMSDNVIRILIGSIAVLFTLNAWVGYAAKRPPAPTTPSPTRGVLWSAVSGFTSFLAHAGAPPMMMYLVPQRLEKSTYVATMNTAFLIINAVKIVPYAWLGQFSRDNLLVSVALAPLVPVGVGLGIWLHRRINEKRFYRVVQVSLLLTGVQLIWQGIAAH